MRFLLAILLLLIAAPAWAQQGQGMSQATVVSSCGGGALPSGALNQLTMDTTGRLCQSGIGSNVCPQATAYLARTTAGNEGGNAVAITALICGLVTDGVIDGTLAGVATCGSHLDVLYVLAQQNQTDALLNLCGTSYSLAQDSPSATFASYQGFHGFTTGMNAGFNPSSAPSPHYTQNSASFGVWSYATVVEGNGQISIVSSTDTHIFDSYTDGKFYARVNGSSTGGVPAPGSQGLFAGDRASSAGITPYWNGVAQTAQSGASSAVANGNFVVGNFVGSTTQTLSAAFIGGSLGATMELALYNRLQAYMTAIAPTGCSQATAYLARATGETTHAADLTTLICGLVTDGVWTNLDALYVLAQQTQADAQLNLIGTSYSLTLNSLLRVPTFTQYVGFSSFVGNFLNTNFNPATATSPKYTQNSASLGAWSYTNVSTAGVDIGIDTTATNILISYSNTFYARVNGANSNSIPTPGTKGLYAGDRSSSANVVPYWNGASQGTQSSTSAAVLSNSIIIGNAVGAAAPTSNTLSAAFVGASLGSAGNLALYNRLRTYLTAVGVP